MALCQLCRGLGNWLLSGEDGDGWLLEYSAINYHGSWKELGVSATSGCPFCYYIIAYFNDWCNYYVHWYRPDDPSYPEAGKLWVEQIEEAQAQGDSTQIEILKGHRQNKLGILLLCGNVAQYSRPGLDVYTLDGNISTFYI